jgi:hypothetical protein
MDCDTLDEVKGSKESQIYKLVCNSVNNKKNIQESEQGNSAVSVKCIL